jgi:hypothetical protein
MPHYVLTVHDDDNPDSQVFTSLRIEAPSPGAAIVQLEQMRASGNSSGQLLPLQSNFDDDMSNWPGHRADRDILIAIFGALCFLAGLWVAGALP